MKLLLIFAAVIPALVLLIQVYRADRLEKEPITMLLGLVLWGMVATEMASLTEQLGDYLLRAVTWPGSRAYDLIFCFVVVAASEEGFKYLLLRWRTWSSPQFNCSFDGVVYAVSLSLGFALWENILYVLRYGFVTALARAVTAVPGHACFGVFMGVWYGLAKRFALHGMKTRSILCRCAALGIPILLHGVYDSFAVSLSMESGWIFLIFVGVLFVSSFLLIRSFSRRDAYLLEEK